MSNHTNTTTGKPRVRLEYLEGLRGLAALYVVFHHAYMELHYRQGGGGIPESFFKLFKFLDFGHYAVDVFIVLSGYCLMLPVARSSDGELRGGFWGYLQRRARRILPSYYATVVFSLLSVVGMLALQTLHHVPDTQVRADNLWSVGLAHLFVIHNLIPDTALFTNPPLWSVASEWQIYFFFPPLLILWRYLGRGTRALLATVLAAFTLGLLPHYLGHGFLDKAYPWYLGLFALGMAGALLNFSPRDDIRIWRERLPWQGLCVVLWLGLAVFGIKQGGWYNDHRWLADPLFGLATLCLLVFATERLQRGRSVPVLNHPLVQRLGTFSYSLYLIHYPLVSLLGSGLLLLGLPPLVRGIVLLGVGVPLIVLVAFVFYLFFEKRRADSCLG